MDEMYFTIIMVVVALVGALAYGIFMTKKNKGYLNTLLQQHPDMARVFSVHKTNLVTEGHVTIHSIDGQPLAMGREGMKVFTYVIPGTRVIEASFSYTRPGVMYKSVTKEWGPVKLEVDIKPHGSYQLTFDKKTEQFELVEL